jgi:hypothetical protein
MQLPGHSRIESNNCRRREIRKLRFESTQKKRGWSDQGDWLTHPMLDPLLAICFCQMEMDAQA